MSILIFNHSLEKLSALVTYFECYLYLYHFHHSKYNYLRL